MACNTRKNTLDEFLKRGVLDESRRIQDLKEFERLNELWSKTAREKYGVEGDLFTIQTRKVERDEKRGTPTQIIHRAVANLDTFDKLDEAVKSYKPVEAVETGKPIEEPKPETTPQGFLHKGLTVKPKTEEEAKRQAEVVLPKMKEILDTLGINTEDVSQIYNKQEQINGLRAQYHDSEDPEFRRGITRQIGELQGEGFSKDAAALADITNRLIQFAGGDIGEEHLTEETLHFVTEILEQKYPELYKNLEDNIVKLQAYTDVKNQYAGDQRYLTSDGRPNFPKIRKEAISQLLSERLLGHDWNESRDPSQNWFQMIWNKISNYIKDLFNSISPEKRDAFSEVADQLIKDSGFITKEDQALLDRHGEFGKEEGFEAKRKTVLEQSRAEMKKNLEDFSEVMPEWAKKGNRPRFKTVDDAANHFLEQAKEITKQAVDISKPEDTEKTFEDKYFFKGIRLPERVTGIVKKAWGKSPFTTLQADDVRKIFREAKREGGTALHKDIQSILQIHTDPETHEFSPEELGQPAEIHTTAEIVDTLQKALVDRLSSYPKGTKFLYEMPVVNFVDGYAGTIDFMAIVPTKEGVRVDVLDWKSNEIFQRAKELGADKSGLSIAPFSQRDWKAQLDLYRRALYYNGVGSPGEAKFGLVRAIPIEARFEMSTPDKNKPYEQFPILSSVEIGSHKVSRIPRDKPYLLPVASETEETGNTKLDAMLKQIWGFRDWLASSKHYGEGAVKWEEIDRVNNAANQLLVARSADDLLNVFNSHFNRIEGFLDRETPWLDEIKPGLVDPNWAIGEKIEDYIRTIEDNYATLNVFNNAGSTIADLYRDLYKGKERTEAQENTISGLNNLAAHAGELKVDLMHRLQDVAKRVGQSYDILDVNGLDMADSVSANILTSLSTHDEHSIQFFDRIYKTTIQINKAKNLATANKLVRLSNNLNEWLHRTETRRSDVWKHFEDPVTGRIVEKVSEKFYKELNKQNIEGAKARDEIVNILRERGFSGDALNKRTAKEYEKHIRPWLEENIDLKQWGERYDESRKKWVDIINDEVYSSDPTIDDRKRAEALLKWEKKNDILHYPEALRGKNYSLRVIEDKWYSEGYRNLLKPENKELLNIYEHFHAENLRAIKSGMLQDIYYPTTFKPFVESEDRLYRFGKDAWKVGGWLWNGAVTASKPFKYLATWVIPSLKNTTEMGEEAELEELPPGESNPITNRATSFIPIYFKRELAEGKKQEKDLLKVFAKWGEHINTYETIKDHESRLNLALAIEQFKKANIEVDKEGIPIPDPKYFGQNEQVYKERLGGKNLETDALLKNYLDTLVYGRDVSDPATTLKDKALRNVLDRLHDVSILYYLGFNIKAAPIISIVGAVRRNAIMEHYTLTDDVKKAQLLYQGLNPPGLGIDTKDALEKADWIRQFFGASLYQKLDPLKAAVGEEGRTSIINSTRGITTNAIMAPFQWAHNYIQEPTVLALALNSTVVDGRIVNISEYVKGKHPDYYSLSKAEQSRVDKEEETEIKALRNKNLFSLMEGEKGDYKISGLDINTKEGFTGFKNFTNLAQYLTKRAMGNADPHDISEFNMKWWSKYFFLFKHFIPEQVRAVFGGLRWNYEKQGLEIGRSTALWHMLKGEARGTTLGLASLHAIPFLNLATWGARRAGWKGARGANESMADVGRLAYTNYSNYLGQRGEYVQFSERQMVDEYKMATDGMLKELQGISMMITAMAMIGVAAANHKKESQWLWNLYAKMEFGTWKQLTMAYDPSSISYQATHMIPQLSMLVDMSTAALGVGNKLYGETAEPLTRGTKLHKDAVKAMHTHPLHKVVGSTPILREIDQTLVDKSNKYRHWMHVKPKKQTF